MAAARKRRYTYLETKNVKAIRRRLVKGDSLSSIAEDYDVALATIAWIADGKTWEDVTVPGWKRYLSERLRLKRRRKPIKARKKKKKIQVKSRKKTINVGNGRRKKKTIALKKSQKTLPEARAPKRPDYDKWNEQFEKGKSKKKPRSIAIAKKPPAAEEPKAPEVAETEAAAPAAEAPAQETPKTTTVPAKVIRRPKKKPKPAAEAAPAEEKQDETSGEAEEG